MKKTIIISLISIMILCGCNSKSETTKKENNNKNTNQSEKINIDTVLTNNKYEKISENIYQRTFDGDNYFYIELDNKTITYNDELDDYQIKYDIVNNTADMYGCRYHFDDNTTTEDGDGIGGCNDDTIAQIKEGKSKIDKEIKKLNINYTDIK